MQVIDPVRAAHMTFEEEVIKLRSEARKLRIENAVFKRKNAILQNRVEKLEQENKQLRAENKLLKQNQHVMNQRLALQDKQIENLNLIVEELRVMVFGKKKRKDQEEQDDGNNENSRDTSSDPEELCSKRKSADRTKDSYRRAVPEDSEVTDICEHRLTHCPDCQTKLISLKQIIRYTEDLADLIELSKLLKKVTKHIIGSGYCPSCKRRKSAIKISPQITVLGENIKQLTSYLTVVMRLSLEQVQCLVRDLAGINLSDGEIILSLDSQAEKLKPERERLLTKIRSAPGAHYDETGWPVQKEGQGNYCWVKRPSCGEEAVFLMGRSRGKANALALQGEGMSGTQTGISDDYGAYQNMFEFHQLCMAHPDRKLRDLKDSKTLSGQSLAHCLKSYEIFSGLYADLRETLRSEYQKESWFEKRDEYIVRLRKIAVIELGDPKKLKQIKAGLDRNAEDYFTCLLKPGIPADNNKAERGLRHVVLKRKNSYGSKSQKGAETMAILCSTLLSAWWNKPANFFVAYNQMLAT